MSEEKSCRICLGSEEPENLIRPCLCNGGMRYVHRDCLNTWRLQNLENGYYSCEICRYRYTFRRMWWGRFLESKITSGVMAAALFAASITVFGYVSANTVNTIWYWFHHEKYHFPHRLQVLFHGLVIIGLPGLYIMLRDFLRGVDWNAPREHVHAPREHVDRPRWVPDYYPQRVYVVREKPEEKKSEKKEEKEDVPKVAEYQSPSLFLWIPLLFGAGKTVYTTYLHIHTKCRTYCSNIQELIENVH